MTPRLTERPMARDDFSSTQMAELQRQFDDGDRGFFDQDVGSYGMDPTSGGGVWGWFAVRGGTRLPPPGGPGDHPRGPADGAEVVVSGDLECSHTYPVLAAITALGLRTGDRVRLVYRHFPICERHLNAQAAAELTEAAADRDAFWEVLDRLFAHRSDGSLG